MNGPRLEIAPDAAAAARAAARFVVECAHRAVAERGICLAAFSGGSTPRAMLGALVTETLPWRELHIFQVDERTAPQGCTIAMAYLELAATAHGLGACWAGFFNMAPMFYPPIYEALNLPKDHQVLGSMMLGVPKFKYHRVPLRNKPVITWA